MIFGMTIAETVALAILAAIGSFAVGWGLFGNWIFSIIGLIILVFTMSVIVAPLTEGNTTDKHSQEVIKECEQ
jgi:uncharacterized protein (DUF697 family)